MNQPAPDVSVIVAIYNALPYLRELLDSLVGQDLGAATMEVILVDDGSTDGSGATIDDYASRDPRVRAVHQANSGGPGGPRNAGIALAAGRYLFFADGDDVLGREALRRLVSFADEHGSDIVIPKLVPLGKRSLPGSVYKKTRVTADLPTAFGTLFPQKLYRRAFVEAHGLRFPEGHARLEDGVFNAAAYVRARRISIVSDYDFYFLRGREHGEHRSRTGIDPASYMPGLIRVCETVRDGVADRRVGDRILLDLYRRKCLERYSPSAVARMPPETLRQWLAAHRDLADRFITAEMEETLESPYRERARMVRRGDPGGGDGPHHPVDAG